MFFPEILEAKQVNTIIGSIACLIPKLPPESWFDINLNLFSLTFKDLEITE